MLDANELNDFGVTALELGHLDEAISYFDQALSVNPNFPGCLYNRGNVNLMLRKFQDALDDYNKALSLDPNFYEVYVNRGQIYQDFLRQPEKAYTDFSWAIAINPRRVEALHNRYLSSMELGRLTEARW